MDEQQILGKIEKLVSDIVTAKGAKVPKIEAGTELLGGGVGMDSLDLAVLVRELEEATGHDPFADGFIEFRTAGELAKLYVR
jgi:acyl carrier protein